MEGAIVRVVNRETLILRAYQRILILRLIGGLAASVVIGAALLVWRLA